MDWMHSDDHNNVKDTIRGRKILMSDPPEAKCQHWKATKKSPTHKERMYRTQRNKISAIVRWYVFIAISLVGG